MHIDLLIVMKIKHDLDHCLDIQIEFGWWFFVDDEDIPHFF